MHVEAYNSNEEQTCINVAILLTESKLKQWVVMPLLSLVTLFVWPILVYWKIPMQRDWLYSQATSVQTASHLYIEGKDGNKEILRVYNLAERSN